MCQRWNVQPLTNCPTAKPSCLNWSGIAATECPPPARFLPEQPFQHPEERGARAAGLSSPRDGRQPEAPDPAFRRKNKTLIETSWGTPLSIIVSPSGDTKKITTTEQARHWLKKKWPVADAAHDRAIRQIEAAMECMAPVGAARQAFTLAARTAGLLPDRHSPPGHAPLPLKASVRHPGAPARMPRPDPERTTCGKTR